MSMKSKSVKRLVILSCAAVIVLGGGAGAYVFRKYQVRAQLAHDRSEGLAAVQQKDYPTAVKDLGEYLSRRPNDIEVQKAYVLVRPQVGAGDIEEVKDTLAHLRQLVVLDPSQSDARRQLMNIYWHYGYAPETEEQAQVLLQQNPKDAEALKYLLFAKLRLRGEELTGSPGKHIASAQEIADRWAAADPENPDPDFLTLDLMQQSGQSPEQVRARAVQLGGKNPQSPLAELILAEAYRITDDRATATQLLKAAAAQPAPSVEFAKTLAQQLNVMGLYRDSLQLLQRQAKTSNDPAIAEELANRQWEMGQSAQVIALTDGIEAKLSTQGKAIRGIALLVTGKKSEAEAIEQELSQTGTPLADAWAMILKQIDVPGGVTARQVADACESALRSETAGRNAYLQYFLAEAYERLGERELAIDGLTKAAQENPTWVVPLVMLSRLELEREQPGMALEAATAAWQRSQQTNVAAAIAIAKAWEVFSETRNQTSGSPNAGPPAQLMQLVNQMHQKLPREEQVLGMYISLLCQSKPSRVAEAKTVIREALADKNNLSEEALIHLASLSRQYQLGVTDECYALAQKKFGMTAALAYAEAIDKYLDHDPAGGLALLQKARTENAKPENVLNWDLANARYLELTGDPRASAAWIALGDANPTNLGLQQTILQVQSVATNRDFLSRTIERVHSLTGDNAITWKLAKARLVLSGNPSQQDLAQTSLDLKQIISQAQDLSEPYALLGECYERLGNLSEALNEMQIAQQKDPANIRMALYYARLLEKHDDFEKAAAVLTAVPTASMTDDERRDAAELLAQEGDSQRATALLASSNTETSQSDLLLASLDLQQNRLADVEALCTKMLAHPTPGAIAFAADFYASHGRMPKAQQTLGLLDNMKLPPGAAEQIRGQFAARFQSIDQAITDLKAGIAAAPDNQHLWLSLVQIELAAGKGDAAKDTLTKSRDPLPNDAALSVLRENQNLLASLCANSQLRSSVVAVVSDPRSDNPVLTALKQIGDSRQSGQTAYDLTASLQSLLDQNPRSLPLRALVIQSYLDLHDSASSSRAAQLATEAMQMFPAEVEPVRLTAISLMAAGQYREALGYLKIWHDRTPGNSMAADLNTGQAYFALDRPLDAAEADKPYASILLAHPDEYATDLMIYAASLNGTGDSDQAAAMIWPLVIKEPAWRDRWITLALRCKTQAEVVAWLEKVQPQVNNDDPTDMVALAEAWHGLAEQSNSAADLKNSRIIFQQLLHRTDLPGQTLEAMAVLDEQLGNNAESETLYRRAIGAKADLPIALNNLAMILARRGEKLDEALAFAQRAVAARPGVATIFDTLAYVQAKKGDYNGAIASIQHAINLEPQSMLWQVHEAKYYWEGGKHKDAQALATKISVMVPPDNASGKQSLREWEALKAEMGKEANVQ